MLNATVTSVDPLGVSDAEQKGRDRYAWFVVFLLMGAYVLSFLDRQILSLMVKPIRADLGISDTEISLLIGIAFSLFFCLCGLPLAHWADTRSRRGLIVVGVALWSIATAACGSASRFGTLFLARMGVGVGEAALSPASFSLLVDYFPRHRRATAISVYSAGVCVGSGLALLLGGALVHMTSNLTLPLIGEVRPWQTVFFMLGGVGLLFCPLLMLVREPVRVKASAAEDPESQQQIIAAYKANKGMIALHHLGFAIFILASYGCAAWIPTFFVRVHAWTPAHVGVVYGSIVAILGTCGMIVGGWAADTLFRRGQVDATLRLSAYSALGAIPFAVGTFTCTDANLAAACLGMATLLFCAATGLGPASIQEMVPANARAKASAFFLLVVNLVGQGLGPTAVALLTDHVFHNDKAVGSSLLVVNVVGLSLAALLLTLARAPYRDHYRRLHQGVDA
jgi:MFS family permease